MTNFKYLTYKVKISMQSRNFMKNVYEELACRLNKVSTFHSQHLKYFQYVGPKYYYIKDYNIS